MTEVFSQQILGRSMTQEAAPELGVLSMFVPLYSVDHELIGRVDVESVIKDDGVLHTEVKVTPVIDRRNRELAGPARQDRNIVGAVAKAGLFLGPFAWRQRVRDRRRWRQEQRDH